MNGRGESSEQVSYIEWTWAMGCGSVYSGLRLCVAWSVCCVCMRVRVQQIVCARAWQGQPRKIETYPSISGVAQFNKISYTKA